MSEINVPAAARQTTRRSILWGVVLGLALGVPAAGLAFALAIAGIAVFNGCYGPRNELVGVLVMAWIFGLWPAAALGAASVPAVMVARGRGWVKALLAFGLGSLIAIAVYVGWFIVAGSLMC